MTERKSQLEEEIESWKGFPWALRKENRELWEAMVQEVREGFGDAVEKSGKALTVDPFFMSLLLAQQRTIKSLLTELESLGVKLPQSAHAICRLSRSGASQPALGPTSGTLGPSGPRTSIGSGIQANGKFATDYRLVIESLQEQVP
jgi:hypothetical protein